MQAAITNQEFKKALDCMFLINNFMKGPSSFSTTLTKKCIFDISYKTIKFVNIDIID